MESRIGKYGGRGTEMTRITRDNKSEICRIRHKVARILRGTVTNAPLAYATGKEVHPPDIDHASDAWSQG